MTKWTVTKENKHLKVSRTTDNKKDYSLGITVPNMRMALSNICLYFSKGDIIDLSGTNETLAYTDNKKNTKTTWSHIPAIMGGCQGLPRN